MADFTVRIADIDLFLDELRHRGPNVEPVVRVQSQHKGPFGFMAPMLFRATYLRAYGERTGVVELVAVLGVWPWMSPDFDAPEERVRAYDEATRRLEESLAARSEGFAARIRAVAEEVGATVAGGRVHVSAEG